MNLLHHLSNVLDIAGTIYLFWAAYVALTEIPKLKKKLRKLKKKKATTDEDAQAPIGFTRPADGE